MSLLGVKYFALACRARSPSSLVDGVGGLASAMMRAASASSGGIRYAKDWEELFPGSRFQADRRAKMLSAAPAV